MHGYHVSRHVVDIAEAIAAGSFATTLVVISLITAVTLAYAWFIA